jgi:hypothetical protein
MIMGLLYAEKDRTESMDRPMVDRPMDILGPSEALLQTKLAGVARSLTKQTE